MSRDPFPPVPAALPSPDPARRALNAWLAVGIALRLAILLTTLPFNADRHFEVIEFIATHGSLPTSNVIDQSYQPPLYYLLMLPLFLATKTATPVHGATFAISCLTLWLVRRAMGHAVVRDLLPRPATRIVAFALAATLPQFAIYAGFISNDGLSYLIGAAALVVTLDYVREPTRGRRLVLATLGGLGLLTKGTLLLLPIAIVGTLILVERARHLAWRTTLARAATVVAIVAAVGCYKFVENTARLGRPIVHNQDLASPTAMMQRNTWRGWQTAVDIDVTQLIRRPVIRAYDPPSYPLLLYGTFWYPYIPEWSYPGNLVGYDRVGSVTYAIAIVPSVAFLVGVAIAVRRAFHAICRARAGGPIEPQTILLAAALLMLTANVAVVLAAGARYGNWSSFHARLCFASAIPLALLLGVGLDASARVPLLRRCFLVGTWASVGCGLLYFLVEFALRAKLLPSEAPIQWW